MNEARSQKALQEQLKLMQNDATALQNEIMIKQRMFSEKNKAIKKLKAQIKKMPADKEVRVSDHAMVRYFERVKKLDVAAIQSEILCPEILKMLKTLGGNGTYPGKGFSVVFKDFTAVTIKI